MLWWSTRLPWIPTRSTRLRRSPRLLLIVVILHHYFSNYLYFVRNYVAFSQTSYDSKAPRFSNKSVPEKVRTMFSVCDLIFSHSIRTLTEKNSDQFLFAMSPNTIYDVSFVQRSPPDEPKLSPIKSLKFSDSSLRSPEKLQSTTQRTQSFASQRSSLSVNAFCYIAKSPRPTQAC